ncbi:MAG: LLM class F420-dependent oxidoreductase [Chloroflexi bacterium]|nr:LLM class F420-dependent oxidoreductase [Chloroflexota bacterium]
MKLGIMIEGQEGLTWERWSRLCRATEDLGFHSLWCSDHFMSLMGDVRQSALETWVALTIAAHETKRVRFGPLVCSMTFRHPSLLGRMAAQVDVLSGGRLEVGVGAGWNVAEHEAFGLPFPPLKQRMDMLEEGVQVLRCLWGKEPATFEGKHYRLKNVQCYPKPAQSPLPIVIGGTGEKRTLRIAAKYAQHWNAVGVNAETLRAKRAVLEQRCTEVKRDHREIRVSVMGGFITGKDDAGLKAHLDRIASFMPALKRADRDQVLAALKSRGWLYGTSAQIVEQLKAFEAAGTTEFMLQHHDQENFGVLEMIAKDVLPKVR